MSSAVEVAVDALVDGLLNGPGELEVWIRQAAAWNDGLPPFVATYAGKVHRHAYRVLDEDVDGLIAPGYTERRGAEAPPKA